MSEIASVWVSVVPSFKGGQQAITKEFGDAGDPAGKKAGKGFLGGLGKALGGAGKIAAGAVAVTGAALAGIAIKGGIDRALNIEDARAKLKGLGHETQSVDGIMQNALASVSGTAYGLGDAATVAAGVVAAGVKPGQDLERTLKLVGDAATIAGTDMGTMGSIFNKVASSDMIQGDVLAQLGDAGIPILQLLSKELGVSSEEVRKLASKGEIDFATFQNAMEAGMGGAALASGDTFRGALANTGAALSRIGETIMTPFLGAMQTGLNGAIPLLDGLNASLKPIMASFGLWLDANMPAIIAGTSAAFSKLGAIGSGVMKGDFSQLGSLFESIMAVTRPAGPILMGVGSAIGEMSGTIGGLVASALPLAIPLLEGMTTAMQFLADHTGILTALIVTLGAGMVAFKVAQAMANAAALLGVPIAIAQATSNLALAAAIRANTAATGTQMVAERSSLVARAASTAGIIGQTIATGAARVAQLAGAAAIGVATAAQWLWNAAMTANPIGIVIVAIAALVGALIWFFTQTELGRAIFQSVFQFIQTTVQNVIGWFTGTLVPTFQQVWASIQAGLAAVGAFFSSTWSSVVSGVSGFIGSVVGFFIELPGKILSALGDLGGLLLNAGGQILEGFLSGLKAGFEKVKDFVGGIGSWIADNKGPKAYDLALLVPAGGWIMSGLEKGIEKSMPSLGSTLGDVSWMIANGIDPQLGGASLGNIAPASGALSSAPSAGGSAAGSGGIERIVLDIGGEQVFASIVRKGERKLTRGRSAV